MKGNLCCWNHPRPRPRRTKRFTLARCTPKCSKIIPAIAPSAAKNKRGLDRISNEPPLETVHGVFLLCQAIKTSTCHDITLLATCLSIWGRRMFIVGKESRLLFFVPSSQRLR